jgi:hypothetical protein
LFMHCMHAAAPKFEFARAGGPVLRCPCAQGQLARTCMLSCMQILSRELVHVCLLTCAQLVRTPLSLFAVLHACVQACVYIAVVRAPIEFRLLEFLHACDTVRVCEARATVSASFCPSACMQS